MPTSQRTSPKDDRGFAAALHNITWEYLENGERSEDETEAMIHACHASLWHWLQVPGHTPTNICVGYWQLSRVYAVAGHGDTAWRYGERSRKEAEAASLSAFYLGYAYEALARAARLRGNAAESDRFLTRAKELAATVSDTEERELLERDLAGL